MEKEKRRIYLKFALAILILLLASPIFVILANSTEVSLVSTQTVTNSLSERVNPITGEPYGDLKQYSVIRATGGAWAGSSMDEETSQHSSGGPAPNTANILWSMQLSGYTATQLFGPDPQNRTDDLGGTVTNGPPDIMVDGKVFVRSNKTRTEHYVNALDPYTGSLIYQIRNTGTGAPAIVDAEEKYFRLTMTGGWSVYEVATGNWVYNATPAPSGTLLPHLKVSFGSTTSENGTSRYLRAWNHTNVFRPPDGVTNRTVDNTAEIWRTQVQDDLSFLCASPDDGVVFFGSWYDRTVFAVNMTDGAILWQHDTPAVSRNALYIEGLFIHHGLQRTITAFNVTTGEIMWEYELGQRTYFGNSGAAGDGLFFAQAIDVPTGWIGAWDIHTGELLWRIPGYFYIGYFSPYYADGKLYAILADGQGVGGAEYRAYNYWSDKGAVNNQLSGCIDVQTGQVLWTMPFTIGYGGGASAGSFSSSLFVAFGCLYFDRYSVLYCIGDKEADAWSNFRGSPNQNAVSSEAGPIDLSKPKWSFKTDGPVSSTPAVADGKVYVGSMDRNIYCLNAYTGDKIWNFSTQHKVQTSVALSGGKVFTGSEDGNIYCLDGQTGEVVWSRNIGGKWDGTIEFYHSTASNQPRSSPIVVGGLLYEGAIDGKVYCLETSNGAIKWSYQTLGPVLGSPCYYKGVIYITSTDYNYGTNGRLFAFDATNGNLNWAVEVPSSERGLSAATPTIAESIKSNTTATAKELGPMVLIGSTSGVYSTKYVHGFYLNGSRARFLNGTFYSISGGGSPAAWAVAYRDNVIYSSSNLFARASNASDGSTFWMTWMVHNTMGSPLVSASISGTRVYFTSDAGIISCMNASFTLNTTTGRPISGGNVLSQFIGLGLASSSPVIWEGKLYIGHGNHYVYCFDNSPTVPISVYANPDKGAQMWSNETITIRGRVHATVDFNIPADVALGSGAIEEQYTPGIRDVSVKVVFVRPDLSSTEVTATTDKQGYFTVQFNPNVVGNWSWTVWYQGKEFPNHSYRYSEAYSEYTTVEVVSPPSSSVSPTPTPTPTPTPAGTPVEYIYAAVAIIAIILIVAAVLLLRKKSK